MESVAASFHAVDWLVVVGYLALTTWLGHRLKGSQATIHDFFLGGRKLPWPAVSGSIIATEISALTFVGVPGLVYAAGGDFTYLQWGIGSVAARFLVGFFLVHRYYAEEIYSPYDYMANRLGNGVGTLTTILFSLGAILGQSVRVLVTATILSSVTVLPFNVCIIVIGIFAVVWTLMGGMTTVIWTDVMQFGLFVFGGLLAVGWLLGSMDGGISEWLSIAGEAGKLEWINLTSPLEDPSVNFTLWVALLAMPFQNLAAFGTDQLNAQRMLCCRNAGDARKAIVWSSISQLITLMMLVVGSGLFVYYHSYPPTSEISELFRNQSDRVFPVWIVTVLPVGLSGLVLAGAFAAAISSLDSILAALSQTTLSALKNQGLMKDLNRAKLIARSRQLVVFWGITLTGFAVVLETLRENTNLVNLAFGMTAYTYGPMLGILALALSGKKVSLGYLIAGLLFSLAVTLYVRPDLAQALFHLGILSEGEVEDWASGISYAWLYPVTCFLTCAPAWAASYLSKESID